MPLPENSEAFLRAYHAAAKDYERERRQPGVSAHRAGTLGAEVADYLDSDKYRLLSSKKQKSNYRRYLDLMRRDFGDFPMTYFTPAKIEEIKKAWARSERPNTWNEILRVMRIVTRRWISRTFTWAPEKIKNDPWSIIGRIEVEPSNQNKEWPKEIVSAILDAASPELRRFLLAALILGQRSGDICKLAPGHYEPSTGTLRFSQGKTKEPMVLPVPRELRPLFDTTQPTLLRTKRGRAWTPHRAQQNLLRVRMKLGIETQYTVPGLRVTNLQRLALAGHDTLTLQSVSGHRSLAALESYLRRLRRHLLAKPALDGLARNLSSEVPKHLPPMSGDASPSRDDAEGGLTIAQPIEQIPNREVTLPVLACRIKGL